ncbi:hypothetical protein [Roseospira visakhapatnamensis]|uniref:Uncharacterized protein n=1 Tax=Roseospira visakhapatnamensis TaxID=390880 RepID=A0A7W6RE77_9PROT|nr:hypothetical protein [Roseospira visakhapatnamensis]MBB4266715.1 hypothetical protein [Roseospira visakhapatnamensis]
MSWFLEALGDVPEPLLDDLGAAGAGVIAIDGKTRTTRHFHVSSRELRPDVSIRRKRKRCGWTNDFARTIIGPMR